MRVAFVTGAGTGIGEATVRRLAGDGYRVALVGRRPEPLERLARELDGLALPADVTSAEELRAAVDRAVAELGGLDALVCNAGIGVSGPAGEETLASWQRTLGVNLTGSFLAVQLALPHLVERRGSIVVVSSTSGVLAGPGWTSYCVSKAGLIMLAKCVARDYGRHGVRANAVMPGWVRTPMGDEDMDRLAREIGGTREDAYRRAHEHHPLGREATAAEIAEVIAFLVSERASYVTGAAVAVDGGATAVDPTAF